MVNPYQTPAEADEKQAVRRQVQRVVPKPYRIAVVLWLCVPMGLSIFFRIIIATGTIATLSPDFIHNTYKMYLVAIVFTMLMPLALLVVSAFRLITSQRSEAVMDAALAGLSFLTLWLATSLIPATV
jgi:hypothetical protein